MSSDANNLRKLAGELRELAAAVDHRKMTKCAQLVVAARGLTVLQEKVRPHA